MFDTDKTGVTRTKPSKPGWKVDLQYYQRAIDWVAEHILKRHGIKIRKVVHDPDLDLWYFYENGEPTTSIDQALLDRIATLMEQSDWYFEDHLEEHLGEDAVMEWLRDKEESERNDG